MLTEQQNDKTRNLDQMTSDEIVRVINDEDKTVAQAVEQALPMIAKAVDVIVEKLAGEGRLVYIGAGTSGRLGVLDAVECVPTFSVSSDKVQGIIAGGEGAFVKAKEGAEDDPELAFADLKAIDFSADDVLVGIAASGRTPYVLGAIEYAQSIGATTVGVACNVPSALLEAAEIGIGVLVGAEVLTGSTRMKAGTAQKMVLNMLSTASMVKLGKVYGNLMVDVQITNEKLTQRGVRILRQITSIDEDRAYQALDAADGSVKAAAVMVKNGVDLATAHEQLAEADGNLRRVIG